MKPFSRCVSVAATFFAVAIAARLAGAAVFTTLDFPGGQNTNVAGFSGGKIVGYYTDSSSGLNHGFVYDGSTYTSFDHPSGDQGTELHGIDGNTLLGFYNNSTAFLYDGSTYTDIGGPPGALIARVSGIHGNQFAGFYVDSGSYQFHGFVYNGSNYVAIDDPAATDGSFATGVSDTQVVGNYFTDPTTTHGFTFDGANYTTVDFPGAVQTSVLGVSGNLLYGSYNNNDTIRHGFVKTDTAYISVDDPSASGDTTVNGVTLNDDTSLTVVGTYTDDLGAQHGYVMTAVPEPSGVVLLVPAAITMLFYGRRRA